MQPESPARKNRISHPHSIVWLTAFILAILVVATVAVVGTCIYSYAHRSDCQISLYDGRVKKETVTLKNAANQQKTDPVIKSQAVQYSGAQAIQQSKNSAFEVNDATQVWKTETAIELFKSEYKNADGVVTVKSADGQKVIAPGTEGHYTFSLKNTSDTPADYKVWVEADLSSNITGVPIQTRMSSDNGWLLGGKSTWEEADALNGVSTSETIDAGRAAEYTIYWQWPFEQGNDEADTTLANASASANQEMSYTVTIYTLTATRTDTDDNDPNNNGAQNNDPNGNKDPNNDQNGNNNPDNNQNNNGNPNNNQDNSDNQTSPDNRSSQTGSAQDVKTGDNTPIFLWTALLGISTTAFLCLFILKKRKNVNKNGSNESDP